MGRQLFTQGMESRQEGWRERTSGEARKERERQMKERCTSDSTQRGEKTGQRWSDIDGGILRWTERQDNRQLSQARQKPYHVHAVHQAHTVTRQSRTRCMLPVRR